MARYQLKVEDIPSYDDIDGYASVVTVEAVVNKSAMHNKERYAELLIHECLESINHAELRYAIPHKQLTVIGKEMSRILLALGWNPPEIPPEGFTIE